MRFSRSIAAVTNLQWFKFFGLDARRSRFTGRLSGGLAEDIARVTCLIYGADVDHGVYYWEANEVANRTSV